MYVVVAGAVRLHRRLTYHTANKWPAGKHKGDVGQNRKRRKVEYTLMSVQAGGALGEDGALRAELIALASEPTSARPPT